MNPNNEQHASHYNPDVVGFSGCGSKFEAAIATMICKSPKRYEKAFASLMQSTPGTAASLDLSHLCFTKERGAKTGAIKIYDTSQEKDTGAILWKRSRFREQSSVAVSVAGSFAAAI